MRVKPKIGPCWDAAENVGKVWERGRGQVEEARTIDYSKEITANHSTTAFRGSKLAHIELPFGPKLLKGLKLRYVNVFQVQSGTKYRGIMIHSQETGSSMYEREFLSQRMPEVCLSNDEKRGSRPILCLISGGDRLGASRG
jgi:hypothetical protein